MDRDQFTFYASFADAVQRIKNKQARCDAYDAIVNYALSGTSPDLDKLPEAAAIAFILARPNLDASRRKAENGRKGGSSEAKLKQEQTGSKPEAKQKQEQTASKKENEKEDKKEDKKEKENECSISPLTPQKREAIIRGAFPEIGPESEALYQAVYNWVQYKVERREPYKETGLKALLSQIGHSAQKHGYRAVIDVINRSMSANYKGIVFDWLEKQPLSSPKKPNKYTTAAEYTAPNASVSTDELYDRVAQI